MIKKASTAVLVTAAVLLTGAAAHAQDDGPSDAEMTQRITSLTNDVKHENLYGAQLSSDLAALDMSRPDRDGIPAETGFTTGRGTGGAGVGTFRPGR
ncbi:hypothetical protein SAVIM338S_00928 [Streptomyces avidinii]